MTLLIIWGVNLRAQLSPEQKLAVDTLDKYVLSDTLTPREIGAHLIGTEVMFGNHLNEDGFLYLLEKLKQRVEGIPTVDDTYLITKIEVYWYSRNGRIGKSLVACDNFKSVAGENPALQLQIDVEEFYAEAYFRLGITDQSLIHNRRLYYLRMQNNPDENQRAAMAADYSWTLTQAAWEFRDTVLMDSSIYFRQIAVANLEKQVHNGEIHPGGITDNFNTYLLALARRKRYEDVITVGHRAWFLTDSLGMNKSPGDIAQRASFLALIARGYLGLQMKDSAFRYHDLAVTLKPAVFPPGEDLPFFYSKLGDYNTAANILRTRLFESEHGYDVDMLNYVYLRSAPIFVKAGMHEEANKCYSSYIAYRDSITKIEEQSEREYQKTNTELQIKEAQHIAELEKQTIEAEAAQQKQKQNFIIAGVAIFAVFLLAFLVVMYNRFKLTKKQKRIIEEKNKEILDSITYAKRIQQAILPEMSLVNSLLRNAFILYKPKDIVAGDFYWVEKSGNSVLVAAADCTGHGVPGAFMSLIGSKELNVASVASSSPGEILSRMNIGVKNTLKQNSADSTRDSIDIALLSIRESDLRFSGANRPLWIVRKGSLETEEIKGTKSSVAGTTEANQKFEEHSASLSSGDTVYIFSDGYADQFGGEKGKKMSTKKFREKLLSVSSLPMDKQKEEMDGFFEAWRGKLEQVDDILLIGIRL